MCNGDVVAFLMAPEESFELMGQRNVNVCNRSIYLVNYRLRDDRVSLLRLLSDGLRLRLQLRRCMFAILHAITRDDFGNLCLFAIGRGIGIVVVLSLVMLHSFPRILSRGRSKLRRRRC